MISTQLHSSINTCDIGYTFHLDESCFVDHRDQDTVNYKTCCLVHLYGSLADLFRDLLDGIHGLCGSIHTCNYLYQLHAVCGIEEVHTDHRTGQSIADLGNGKAGGVGSEYTLRLADLVQLTEGGLLNFHVLECSFYDQIAVCTQVFLQTRSDLSYDSVNCFLGHFSFFYQSCIAFNDLCFAAFSPFLLNIAESYFISVYLGKCLCNALSHGTCTDNTYFHGKSSCFLYILSLLKKLL